MIKSANIFKWKITQQNCALIYAFTARKSTAEFVKDKIA